MGHRHWPWTHDPRHPARFVDPFDPWLVGPIQLFIIICKFSFFIIIIISSSSIYHLFVYLSVYYYLVSCQLWSPGSRCCWSCETPGQATTSTSTRKHCRAGRLSKLRYDLSTVHCLVYITWRPAWHKSCHKSQLWHRSKASCTPYELN